MAKTGRSTATKAAASKAKSGKQTKTKVISKAKSAKAKSAKSTTVPGTPARKSASSSKQKWAAPFEKKIKMFKNQGDYFGLNAKYSQM